MEGAVRRTIRVQIGTRGRSVGLLYYDQRGARESAAFEYEADWLAAPDGFALQPDLALMDGPQFHRSTGRGSVFHAALADTEPDGWGRRVIQRDFARQRQEARRAGTAVAKYALNSLDFLLRVDDFSRVGALRLIDEDGLYFRIALPRARELLAQVEHAVADWRNEARGLGMSETDVNDFADAFEHEERCPCGEPA